MIFMKTQSLRLSTAWLAALLVAFAATTLWTKPASAQAADDQQALRSYSLYYESYKNKDYRSALPYLRWILNNAPAYGGPNRTTDNNFERATEVYAGVAKQAEDEATAKAYRDTALTLFETAPARLQEAGVETDEAEWLIKKGRFIQQNPDVVDDAQSAAAEAYLQAYELDPEAIDAYSLQYIVNTYVEQGEKQKAADLLDQMEAQFGDDQEMMAYITQVRESLFTNPAERLAFLQDQLENNPGDTEMLTEAVELAVEQGDRQALNELGPKLLEAEPSARVFRLLADMHREDGEYQEAMELYEQALEQPDADEHRRDIYYSMGLAQQQMGSLSRARTYFRQALEEDSSYGSALMAIGDLYATAVSECGSMEADDRAVYWLAVDYFNRAKQANPSLSNEANQKIRTYQRYYPTAEMLFFKNLEAGDSYTVSGSCYGWINETTTVKAP